MIRHTYFIRFCYQCLLRMSKSAESSVQCPVCRQSFRLECDLTSDRALEREIAAMVTTCGACRKQVREMEILLSANIDQKWYMSVLVHFVRFYTLYKQ